MLGYEEKQSREDPSSDKKLKKPKRAIEEFKLMHAYEILKDTSVFMRGTASNSKARKRRRVSQPPDEVAAGDKDGSDFDLDLSLPPSLLSPPFCTFNVLCCDILVDIALVHAQLPFPMSIPETVLQTCNQQAA